MFICIKSRTASLITYSIELSTLLFSANNSIRIISYSNGRQFPKVEQIWDISFFLTYVCKISSKSA